MTSRCLSTPSPTTSCRLTVYLTLLSPLPAAGQNCGCESGIDTIPLTGLVRDFRETGQPGGHWDFEVTIPTGSGIYGGNVDHYTHETKPVFVGGGKKVHVQGTDASGRPIAPHLCNKRFAPDSGLAPQATSAILKDSQSVDAYEITFISAEFNDDGTSTWVYHVAELETGKDLSHWLLVLDPAHQIEPGTTAGYSYGVDGSTGFHGIKWDVNDAFEQGTFTIVLDQHYAGDDSTCSVVAKGGNSPDQGDLFAPTVTVSTTGTPFNGTGGGLVNDPALGDSDPVYGVTSSGGIESPFTFSSWYRDDPPLNMSTILTVEMIRQEDCTYLFDAGLTAPYASLGGFFPIEDQLLGNPGGMPDRNFHFTFEVHTTFTYDAAADQYLRFEGDDDVWVFIDGKLAIDLGGIHTPAEQYADLDRMGLEDGETYTIDMFFAERHRTQSNFLIETNFCLESTPPEMVSAIFD